MSSATAQSEVRSVDDITVPTHQIRLAPTNFGRHVRPKEADASLVASIRKNGLLQPLVVEKIAEDQYEVVVGERRLLALRVLGEPLCRVSVRTFANNKKRAMASAVENIERKNLTVYEETMVIYRLATKVGIDIQELRDHFGFPYKELRAMIRAPEVLSKKELAAFAQVQNPNAARLYLVAAMKRSADDRARVIAAGPTNKKPQRRGVLDVDFVREMLASDETKGAKFLGAELTQRERTLVLDTLAMVGSRGRAVPFEVDGKPHVFDRKKSLHQKRMELRRQGAEGRRRAKEEETNDDGGEDEG